MTDSEVEAFLAVCRCGSITKAAEQLFINQSSLSTKIKILESEVGCPLIERSKGSRRLSLTDEGRRFYDMALKYEELVDNMLSVGRENLPLTLRISSVSSTGTYLFAPVYEKFMQEMPDVVLEVQDMVTKSVYTSIEEGMTDIAFTVRKLDIKKTMEYPAFSEEMVFVCHRGADYPKAVDIADIDIKNEIYIRWHDGFVEWHNKTFGAEAAPLIRLELMSQLEFFIKKKNAWAIVPASTAYAMGKAGLSERRDKSFEIPKRITYCTRVPNKAKANAANCFMDCLKRTLEEMAEPGVEIFLL
ncbi:MAG: LysR family transcriptional regulator [Clostridiales bacterium]|nr:LysR family transcriptional regulator [Clostridiales bacterium]